MGLIARMKGRGERRERGGDEVGGQSNDWLMPLNFHVVMDLGSMTSMLAETDALFHAAALGVVSGDRGTPEPTTRHCPFPISPKSWQSADKDGKTRTKNREFGKCNARMSNYPPSRP